MITIWMYIAITGAALSWIFTGITYWQIRRWHKLNDLLFDIVMKSFMHQHLPIWHAWSAMTGCRFRINIEDRRRS